MRAMGLRRCYGLRVCGHWTMQVVTAQVVAATQCLDIHQHKLRLYSLHGVAEARGLTHLHQGIGT